MTEEQLKTFRAECRTLAYKSACAVLLKMLAPTGPAARQSLLQSANQMREQYALMTIPGRDAAESDLMAAEFQDAFDEMLQLLVDGSPPSAP